MKIEELEIAAVKERADIVEIIGEHLKLKKSSGNYVALCPFHKENSPSFTIKPSENFYHCFGCGASGDAISFIQKYQNLDFQSTVILLAGRYNVPLKTKEKVKHKAAVLKKIYHYRTADGETAHQTLRYEPGDKGARKTFKQRRPVRNDEIDAGFASEQDTGRAIKFGKNPYSVNDQSTYISNLKGVPLQLYRIFETEFDEICLVEGEKDVDTLRDKLNFPATTCAQGSGHWLETYNQYFKGKKVVIIQDNDSAGEKRTEALLSQLKTFAKSIKILVLSDKKGGDVTDWYEAGGTAIELRLLIDKKTATDMKQVQSESQKSTAKLANSKPLTNSWVEDDFTKPRRPSEIVSDVHSRFFDFPRMLGGALFDHDRKSGDITAITKSDELFAWMQLKGGDTPIWNSKAGNMSKSELFCCLKLETKYKYDGVFSAPHYPIRKDVYYLHKTLPKPTATYKYFKKFASFFNGCTDLDNLMIQTAIATPLFFKDGESRPMFIIDSKEGYGTGKTTLVNKIARLYDEYALEITPRVVKQNPEELDKRLLSTEGRKKRIILMDNLTGRFNSDFMAAKLTARAITGRAPYGHGEETRPNDITVFITTNSAEFDLDQLARSFFIDVKKPKYSPTWSSDIDKFVDKYRYQILADIMGMVESYKNDGQSNTRFSGWENSIFKPIVGDKYQDVLNHMEVKKSSVDHDSDDCNQFMTHIQDIVAKLGLSYTNDTIYIHSNVFQNINDEHKIFDGKRVAYRISNHTKTGVLPLVKSPLNFPSNGKYSAKGYMLNDKKDADIYVIGLNKFKVPECLNAKILLEGKSINRLALALDNKEDDEDEF